VSTLLEFTTAPGSWGAHYWIANETLSSDGHYVEFIVTSLLSGSGYGVSPDGDGSATNSYALWLNSGVTYILLNGSVNATYAGVVVSKFDRIRFRKSGSNVIVSHNGTDFHTISLAGTIYAYAASFDGSSSVNVDSVNGAAVTTLVSAACTVTDGVPSTDYFSTDSLIYYSKHNWLASGRYKESSQPGSYFKFAFSGTKAGIIYDAPQVGLAPSEQTYLSYRIDGGSWTRVLLDRVDVYLEIATGLADTTHQAEVAISDVFYGARYDASSRAGSVFSYGVRLPTTGTLLAPPVYSILAMGFCDSNSEGAEALGTSSGTAQLGFMKLIADAIGMELSPTSAPAQGWDATPAAGIPTLEDGWDINIDLSSRLTTGALVPEPYVIFIAHGQNDTADITTVATGVVNAMLAATTNTKIVIMCPVGRHRRTELIAVVAAVANSRCVFFDNATDYLDAYSRDDLGIHLTQTGQSLYSTVEMIPQFRTIIPRIQSIRHYYSQQGAV